MGFAKASRGTSGLGSDNIKGGGRNGWPQRSRGGWTDWSGLQVKAEAHRFLLWPWEPQREGFDREGKEPGWFEISPWGQSRGGQRQDWSQELVGQQQSKAGEDDPSTG